MKVTLELSEKYPTGWLVVDTIDISRFNENEVSEIVEFNQYKNRRCAIKRRPERARITAEEITNAVLLNLTDILKPACPECGWDNGFHAYSCPIRRTIYSKGN